MVGPHHSAPRTRTWLVRALMVGCIAAITVVSTPRQSLGTNAAVLVTANIISMTSIDMTGCTAGVVDKTTLTAVLPGVPTVTGIDCNVAFGSSNNTAQLLIGQTDALGSAMWMPTRGALDATWDGPSGVGNGDYTLAIGTAADTGSKVLQQTDGTILTIGTCLGVTDDFCFVRSSATGVLDTSFDGPSGTGNGKFLLPVGTGVDTAKSAVLQPDGKLIAVGTCANGADDDFCLVRLETNGTLDLTFDGPSGSGDGKVFIPVGLSADGIGEVSLLPDGRIVVSGACSNGTNTVGCFARLLPNGTLDDTWDGPSGTGNGVFLSPLAATGDNYANDHVLQPDGKLVAAGTCGTYDFCVTRLTTTGALDVTFDGPSGTGNGRFSQAIGAGSDRVTSIALQPDGNIIVAGYCDGAVFDVCLARFTPTGALDATFDGPSGTGNGKFVYPFETADDDIAYDVLLQRDGSIMVAGLCFDGGVYTACTGRLTRTGALDTTFGTNGRSLYVFGGANDVIRDLELLHDGKVAATGRCSVGMGDFCMAQNDTGPKLSDYSNLGGGSDTDFSSSSVTTNTFAACLRDVSGGAFATWSSSGTCGAADSITWNDVPATAEAIAYTTAFEPDPVDATASIRFGIRGMSSQKPGSYFAPVTFTVVAP